MKKINTLCIFGTRPEASKMLPLVLELKKHPFFCCEVCVTAQHRSMLDQVLDVFQVTPDYDLDIMKDRQTLLDITLGALSGLDHVLKQKPYDLVLVHGDTTTTFAASLAAYYNQIKVGHVEAGLRTFEKYEPFPEEMNRRLTDVISDLYFAPTEKSKQNLLREGIAADAIYITGNTAIDSFETTITSQYSFENKQLNRLDFTKEKVIVITAHRRENWGEGLEQICRAVLSLCNEFHDIKFVYAVHKNPVVMDTVKQFLGNHPQILLTEPLELRDMHNLMNRCHFIMTDSGGIQEEAPSLNKPVLVLRNVTERPEGLATGALKLAGTSEKDIYNISKELLTNQKVYTAMQNAKNPFGDGRASKRIIEGILHHFGMLPAKPEDFII